MTETWARRLYNGGINIWIEKHIWSEFIQSCGVPAFMHKGGGDFDPPPQAGEKCIEWVEKREKKERKGEKAGEKLG